MPHFGFHALPSGKIAENRSIRWGSSPPRTEMSTCKWLLLCDLRSKTLGHVQNLDPPDRRPIFVSSSHLINDPINAISLVVFSSLIGFGVRFDTAKAGESGHSLLVPPCGKPSPRAAPHNLLVFDLGTLLPTLLLCRVINGYKLPQMDMLVELLICRL
jgi:hypothetical protein